MWSEIRQSKTFLLLMSLALPFALAFAEGGGAKGPVDSTPVNSGTGGAMPVAAQEATPVAAAAQVVIDNFTFNPPQLTVAVGTKVTWVNRDDVPHTATSTSKPRNIDSGTLDTDDKFSHLFTAPGTYEYFCAVHPKMIARIIVK
jgi:plastocyanin